MQIQITTNPVQKQLRESVAEQDLILLVRVNYGLQVILWRAQSKQSKNITVGMSKAFGYALQANGLVCSEMQIIEDLALAVPQISQPSGELNIRLKSIDNPYERN